MIEINYNEWKYNVNKIVFNKTGYNCDQLEDYAYADSYYNYISPLEVANTVISIFENNKDIYYNYNNPCL